MGYGVSIPVVAGGEEARWAWGGDWGGMGVGGVGGGGGRRGLVNEKRRAVSGYGGGWGRDGGEGGGRWRRKESGKGTGWDYYFSCGMFLLWLDGQLGMLALLSTVG